MVCDLGNMDSFRVFLHQPILSSTAAFAEPVIILGNTFVADFFRLGVVCFYAAYFVASQKIPA